jgi:hypothetical protein
MINKKHLEDLKQVVETLIDEVAAIQAAINDNVVGPEEIRDFYGVIDFSEYRLSGIMYAAGIDGAYMQDEDE